MHEARIKELEDMITQSFLDEEGQAMCPFDLGTYEYCEGCPVKDLCDEAEKIVKKESTTK